MYILTDHVLVTGPETTSPVVDALKNDPPYLQLYKISQKTFLNYTSDIY